MMLQEFFSEANSPRVLNAMGLKLYAESGAKDALEKNMDMLIEQMESLNLKTALDVESTSSATLYEKCDEDMFKPIKDFLFTHPEYEGVSIDLSTIIFVMSIPLRDKYLGKHPEIDPRTLDQKES